MWKSSLLLFNRSSIEFRCQHFLIKVIYLCNKIIMTRVKIYIKKAHQKRRKNAGGEVTNYHMIFKNAFMIYSFCMHFFIIQSWHFFIPHAFLWTVKPKILNMQMFAIISVYPFRLFFFIIKVNEKNITLSERCYKVFISRHTVQDRYRRFCYVNAYFLLALTDIIL